MPARPDSAQGRRSGRRAPAAEEDVRRADRLLSRRLPRQRGQPSRMRCCSPCRIWVTAPVAPAQTGRLRDRSGTGRAAAPGLNDVDRPPRPTSRSRGLSRPLATTSGDLSRWAPALPAGTTAQSAASAARRHRRGDMSAPFTPGAGGLGCSLARYADPERCQHNSMGAAPRTYATRGRPELDEQLALSMQSSSASRAASRSGQRVRIGSSMRGRAESRLQSRRPIGTTVGVRSQKPGGRSVRL